MRKRVFKLDFFGRKIVVEHGELAKQATGSVLVRYNDTVVLTAVVVNKNVNLLSLNTDFKINTFMNSSLSIIINT